MPNSLWQFLSVRCGWSPTKHCFKFNMDKIINLGIPHVAELVFESIDTPELIKCLEVSETWKVLAENVLIKRCKGKMFEACKNGQTKVVQLLLECCTSEESGLNIKDFLGRTKVAYIYDLFLRSACFCVNFDVNHLK